MDEQEFEKRLKALCDRFDKEIGSYPEHEFEGEALYVFYQMLKRGDNPNHYHLRFEIDKARQEARRIEPQ